MKENNVNLRKPIKRYTLKKEDRVVRLQDYLENIWMVKKYFYDTYGIQPPIINGDQMSLHRNERVSEKTLPLKSERVFVKENYMLSRERVTCLTQLCNDTKVTVLPEVKVLEHIWYLQKDTKRIVSHPLYNCDCIANPFSINILNRLGSFFIIPNICYVRNDKETS